MEVQAREVDGDRLGDRVRRGNDLDLVLDQIDGAALLETGRGFAVLDVDGDGDAHLGACAQAHEVDMQRLVGDDVELVIAREHALDAAADVEFEDRGQKVAGVDELVELLEFDRNRFRLFAAAINNTWYAAIATNGAGGPLAYPATRHGRELLVRCHVGFPF